jgi:hypothetical protein
VRHRAVVWIVPLLLLGGLVTGLAAPSPAAQAAQESGGGLISRQSTNASIGTAGDTLAYTFSGTARQHVDFDVTASSWSTDDGATLSWYRPDGSLLDQCNVAGFSQTAQPCDTTLDASGTWTLGVEPADDGTGRVVFTYLTDQDLGTLTPATATTTTFGSTGQNALYRFAGTAGRRVLFNITAFDLGSGGTARLSFTAPDGSTDADSTCILSKAPDSCTLTPDATGVWTVSLDPTDSGVGAVTFGFAADQAGGALKAGTSVTAVVAAAGQNATYSFAAIKGRPITFTVSTASWISKTPGYLYFYAPGASALTSHCSAAVGVNCRIIPAVSGSWRLTVSASGGTGRTTFTYRPDLNRGTLKKGTPVLTKITAAGQNAAFTFPATKGRATKLVVTSSSWTKGAVVRLWVFPPSGAPLFDSCTVAKKTTCTTVPNAGGSWRLELDPQGSAVGRITMVRR